MDYTVRIGRAKSPAQNYDELYTMPYKETEDDGKEVTVTREEDWPDDIPCLDCGGEIFRAEAGYVPGHRICKRCGSRWSLEGKGEGKWNLKRARYY